MKRFWMGSLLLLLCAAPARAHFVWIVPEKGEGAQLIFSDSLEPDTQVPVTKIAQTEVFTRGADDKTTALKPTLAKAHYRVAAPAQGPCEIGGVCRYGVVQRGKAEPFLLVYHARAHVGGKPWERPPGGWRPWDRLELDIVPSGGMGWVEVRWQGKPLANAEVVFLLPGQDKPAERKTDKSGIVNLEKPRATGVYGIRARHVEVKEGAHDGKKYKEVRYYATLTFRVTAVAKEPGPRGAGVINLRDPLLRVRQFPTLGATPVLSWMDPPFVIALQQQAKPNPAATKLLRDARAARANWEKFRGFSADLAYNHNGQIAKGHVDVSAEGRVKVDLPDVVAKAWAQRQLQSVVDHRLDSSAERDTPCAFIGDNTTHPLGRAIKVLNDELHSSYRIRGREIIEVNRTMKSGRFTITVLENRLTPEKKYLPTAYVVNTWAGEVLRSSMAFHQTWQRVGTLDLPKTILVVTATGAEGSNPSGVDARTLTLSNLKLPR